MPEGDTIVLRTHMRMKGAWRLYRPDERWQRPHHDMRIVIGTDAFEVVAFNVAVAEFASAREMTRARPTGARGVSANDSSTLSTPPSRIASTGTTASRPGA